MSGWVRTFTTSSRSCSSWSVTTPKDCQLASTPGGLTDPDAQLGLRGGRHRAAGVRDHEDAPHVEEVDAEHERLERLRRDPAAGVAEDLGVAVPEAEHPQRVDAGVHARHDGDPGVSLAVEAAEVEGGGELAVGVEQVGEVVHDREISGATTAVLSRMWCVDARQVADTTGALDPAMAGPSGGQQDARPHGCGDPVGLRLQHRAEGAAQARHLRADRHHPGRVGEEVVGQLRGRASRR